MRLRTKIAIGVVVAVVLISIGRIGEIAYNQERNASSSESTVLDDQPTTIASVPDDSAELERAREAILAYRTAGSDYAAQFRDRGPAFFDECSDGCLWTTAAAYWRWNNRQFTMLARKMSLARDQTAGIEQCTSAYSGLATLQRAERLTSDLIVAANAEDQEAYDRSYEEYSGGVEGVAPLIECNP